jgi:hypothetical protein
MSTPTTAPVPQPAATTKVVLGTTYDFSNHKKSVEISYNTERRGPPPTEFIVAATLTYNGPEGQLKFTGSQIQSQDTPLGTLLSVVLKVNEFNGNTNLSIFLPAITFGTTSDMEKFSTYMVKSQVHPHLIAGINSVGMTYDVEPLTGIAREIVDETNTTV